MLGSTTLIVIMPKWLDSLLILAIMCTLLQMVFKEIQLKIYVDSLRKGGQNPNSHLLLNYIYARYVTSDVGFCSCPTKIMNDGSLGKQRQ